MADTFQTIKKVLTDLQFKTEGMTAETSLIDDLELDSLDHVEVAMGVEDELDIQINDDDLTGVVTVGDMVRLVDRARSGVR